MSYIEGIVKGYNDVALDEIKAMKSYRGIEIFVQVGSPLKKTIDCYTWIGNIQLVVTFVNMFFFVVKICSVIFPPFFLFSQESK